MNTREKTRKTRIDEILKALKKQHNHLIDMKKLTFEIMFKYAVTRRRAKEYLETAISQLKK